MDPARLESRRSEGAPPSSVAEETEGYISRVDLGECKHLGLGIDLCGLIWNPKEVGEGTVEEPTWL